MPTPIFSSLVLAAADEPDLASAIQAAYLWHQGGGGLYAFASTGGKVEDEAVRQRMLQEVEDCMAFVHARSEDIDAGALPEIADQLTAAEEAGMAGSDYLMNGLENLKAVINQTPSTNAEAPAPEATPVTSSVDKSAEIVVSVETFNKARQIAQKMLETLEGTNTELEGKVGKILFELDQIETQAAGNLGDALDNKIDPKSSAWARNLIQALVTLQRNSGNTGSGPVSAPSAPAPAVATVAAALVTADSLSDSVRMLAQFVRVNKDRFLSMIKTPKGEAQVRQELSTVPGGPKAAGAILPLIHQMAAGTLDENGLVAGIETYLQQNTPKTLTSAFIEANGLATENTRVKTASDGSVHVTGLKLGASTLGAMIKFAHTEGIQVKIVKAFEEESAACPACGGAGVPLGSLGNRMHLRCRNCGMGFSHDVESAPVSKGAAEQPELTKPIGAEGPLGPNYGDGGAPALDNPTVFDDMHIAAGPEPEPEDHVIKIGTGYLAITDDTASLETGGTSLSVAPAQAHATRFTHSEAQLWLDDDRLSDLVAQQGDGAEARIVRIVPKKGSMKQANQYIVNRPGKDSEGNDAPWCILQKGTGKVLSRHTSEAKAEEAFGAMEAHKHADFVQPPPPAPSAMGNHAGPANPVNPTGTPSPIAAKPASPTHIAPENQGPAVVHTNPGTPPPVKPLPPVAVPVPGQQPVQSSVTASEGTLGGILSEAEGTLSALQELADAALAKARLMNNEGLVAAVERLNSTVFEAGMAARHSKGLATGTGTAKAEEPKAGELVAITARLDEDDKDVHVHGFATLNIGIIKKKILDQAKEGIKRAEAGDWPNALYFFGSNGVFPELVKTLIRERKEEWMAERSIPEDGIKQASGPDDHQKRICIDTVKNPAKGQFLGGPSAEEAEETLRTKFHYTPEQIKKLKTAAIDDTKKTPARGCNPWDITWGEKGGQCTNCGGEGPSCYEVKHAPQPKQSAEGTTCDNCGKDKCEKDETLCPNCKGRCKEGPQGLNPRPFGKGASSKTADASELSALSREVVLDWEAGHPNQVPDWASNDWKQLFEQNRAECPDQTAFIHACQTAYAEMSKSKSKTTSQILASLMVQAGGLMGPLAEEGDTIENAVKFIHGNSEVIEDETVAGLRQLLADAGYERMVIELAIEEVFGENATLANGALLKTLLNDKT